MRRLGLLGVGVFCAFVFVLSRLQTLHLQFEVTQLTQRATALSEEVEGLRSLVARQKNPAALERLAGELQLRMPKPQEVVHFNE